MQESNDFFIFKQLAYRNSYERIRRRLWEFL